MDFSLQIREFVTGDFTGPLPHQLCVSLDYRTRGHLMSVVHVGLEGLFELQVGDTVTDGRVWRSFALIGFKKSE